MSPQPGLKAPRSARRKLKPSARRRRRIPSRSRRSTSSDSRNRIMSATSSARPRRPSGCSSSSHCRPVMLSTVPDEAGGDHRRVDVARMHRVAADVVLHLRAMQRHVLGQRPHRALAGAVGHRIGGAAQAEHRGDVDDRAAARPALIAGIAVLQPRNVPSELMSLTRRYSSRVQSSIELRTPTPAAFSSPCRPPKVSTVAATAFCQAGFVGDVERHESGRRAEFRRRARGPWPRRGRPAPPCRLRARPGARSRRRCPRRRR